MAANRKNMLVLAWSSFFLILLSLSSASAQEFDAMKGVDDANVIFDMRDGIPKSPVVHMKLIHDTYKQLMAMKKNPVFVVVFLGSAVKPISSNRAEVSPEDQKHIKEIGDAITKMSKEGIDAEVCLFAAKVFGVDPASIRSEVRGVPNGWVSEIGYQAWYYSLGPVY